MPATNTGLERLKAELGDQAHLLQYTPFEKLVTAELFNEPQAVSFKVMLGYFRARRDNGAHEDSSEHLEDGMLKHKKHEVWIHLYPAHNSRSHAEIQFHAYDSNGGYIGKLDGENISKVISGCVIAFVLPSRYRWSRAKLVALAKYYFLRKIAESNNESDQNKSRYGVSITKTFKDDVIAVCREFGEEVKKPGSVTVSAANLEQGSSQESVLSEEPNGLVDEHDPAENPAADEERMDQTKAVTAVAHTMNSASDKDIMQTLLSLNSNEDTLTENIAKIEEEMGQLEAQRRAMHEERAEIVKRKKEMLGGMSAEAAFNLGRQVERDGTQKRRRLD